MNTKGIITIVLFSLASVTTAFARPAGFAKCNITKRFGGDIFVTGSGMNYGKKVEIFKKDYSYPVSGYDVEVVGSSNPYLGRATIGNLTVDVTNPSKNRTGKIYISEGKRDTIFVHVDKEPRVFGITIDSGKRTGVLKMYDAKGEQKLANLRCEASDIYLFQN